MWVICVREDTDINDVMACIDYMDPDVCCQERMLNLITHLFANRSLSGSLRCFLLTRALTNVEWVCQQSLQHLFTLKELTSKGIMVCLCWHLVGEGLCSEGIFRQATIKPLWPSVIYHTWHIVIILCYQNSYHHIAQNNTDNLYHAPSTIIMFSFMKISMLCAGLYVCSYLSVWREWAMIMFLF